MNWIHWLISSGTVFVAVLLAWHSLKRPLQEILISSVSAKVSSVFERQIEKLRSELKQHEQKLIAQLNADQADIEALRVGALSALNNRNAILTQKKIEAAEMVWSAMIELRSLLPVAQLMTVIKFKSAADGAKNNPRIKEMFEQLGVAYNVKAPTGVGASQYRLFVSKKAWSYFNAYQIIIYDTFVQFQAIKLGVGSNLYADGAVHDIVKTTLPEFSDLIEKNRNISLYFMLEPLQEFLLSELQTMLNGSADDHQAVSMASEILRISAQAHQDIKSPEQARLLAELPPELKRQ
jgi:hypothetical protein